MNEPIEVEAEVIAPPTDIEVTYKAASLAADFTALSEYIDKKLALYEGITIDPDDEGQIKAGRAVCADLNKLAEPLDKRRKEIKKEYEKPLKAFEAQVKTITDKIAAARKTIDDQIKAADVLYKERKYVALEDHYQGIAGEFCELIPYDKIHEDKWLNRSEKISKVEGLISDKAAKILSELATLKSTPLEYSAEAKLMYYNTVDLQSALSENQRLIDAKKELDDKEAIAQKLEESVQKAHEAVIEAANPVTPSPKMKLHYTLEFIATREQALLIRDQVNAVGARGLVFSGVEVNE